MELEIKQVFSGREIFCLPPKQSKQYLRIFPDTPTRSGLIVCRVPEEYKVSAQAGDIKVSGNIIEHPNGYSWFILISKKWHYTKAFSGIAPTVEKARKQIEKLLNQFA